jgi:hypothetical protein
MERPCPVSPFCLALEPDSALALIPHRGYARESQLLHLNLNSGMRREPLRVI